MLVSAMMCAPRSMPDISEGDSVSPAMGEDDVAALGALGLDHRGKPREAAAALAIRLHLLGHLVDVVDQDEGYVGRFGACRQGKKDE